MNKTIKSQRPSEIDIRKINQCLSLEVIKERYQDYLRDESNNKSEAVRAIYFPEIIGKYQEFLVSYIKKFHHSVLAVEEQVLLLELCQKKMKS